MRLIDADALLAAETFTYSGGDACRECETEYRLAILDAPTVDAVPVVHGRWIYNTDDFTPAHRCSACGYNKPMIAGEGVSQGAMNYCPNCGAKMDGGTDGAK